MWTPLKAVFVIFVVAVVAMLLFAAATQGYFFARRNRIYETVALLLIAFTLFRPGYLAGPG